MEIIVNKHLVDFFNKNKLYSGINGVRFKENDKIIVPNEGYLEEYSSFNQGNVLCQMGAFSYSNAAIARTDLKIGRYCSIAPHLNFRKTHHPLSILSTSSFAYDGYFIIFRKAKEVFQSNFQTQTYRDFVAADKPTIFMDDVYVCTNACLKPGITLHTGCVVGQNAMVTKDVPPYAVVAGNPGRIVKYRFDEKTIERLLKLKWWEYNFCDFDKIDLKLDINHYLDKLEARIENKEIYPFKPKKFDFQEIIEISKHKTQISISKAIEKSKILSAKAQIHNHLSYKLGNAMIKNSKHFKDYIKLPLTLLNITKKHKKEQEIFRIMTQFNPSLALPKLEQCSDYKEALKEKECFTYKLGLALIKAHKNWHRGGVFELFSQRAA